MPVMAPGQRNELIIDYLGEIASSAYGGLAMTGPGSQFSIDVWDYTVEGKEKFWAGFTWLTDRISI